MVNNLEFTPAQKHKLLLISCEKFDPLTQTIACETLHQAKNLLLEVKSKKDEATFADIPLDLKHYIPEKNMQPFPAHWLRKSLELQ